MQHDMEQRTVDLQSAFGSARVVNETELPEPVHKEAHPGTGGPNHLGQSLLADLRNDGLRNAFLAKVGE